MPPLSRRARLVLAAGCLTALAAGALPVLLAHHGHGQGVNVQAAGSVAAGPGADLAAGDPGTALTPGDPSPIEPADPSTSITTGPPAATSNLVSSSTTGPAPASTTSTTAVGMCAVPALRIQAQADAATYRPGDPITVTAVVTNTATRTCLFDDSRRFGEYTCPAQVSTRQTVYLLDGAAPNPCPPTSVVLVPGDQVSSSATFPFKPPATCGPSSEPCSLPSGTWTGAFTWNYGTGNPSVTAPFSFTCPADACTAPPSPSTSSTSTTSTSSSSSTTSSTTTPTTR